MIPEKYRGIFPAFYACYEEDGSISRSRTQALTRRLMEKGVQGLYVGGSSGECIYLSVEERQRILEWVMEEAAGKLTVIAHVAANSTRDSVQLARHAEQLGADAIAAIPPIYFKLPEHAIARYWNDISAAAPHTDFIIYNIPQLAGVALTPNLCHMMCSNPRVTGVKNSSVSVQDIQTFQAIGGDNFVVFNGPDEQFLAGRLMGASGGIGGTYAVMPELFLKMDKLIRLGHAEQATPIQARVNDIISMLCGCHGHMYAAAKAVLGLDGVNIGGVRSPLSNLNDSDIIRITNIHQTIKQAIREFA